MRRREADSGRARSSPRPPPTRSRLLRALPDLEAAVLGGDQQAPLAVPVRPLDAVKDRGVAEFGPRSGRRSERRSSRIAAYVPRTVRRSPLPDPGRGFSTTMRSPRFSSQASLGSRGGASAVSVQPRRRSTANASARDIAGRTARTRVRARRDRLVHVPNRCVLDKLHPARPRAPDPPRSERREPRQPRDRDVRGAELPLGGLLHREVREPPAVGRQVAPLRVDRPPEPCPGSYEGVARSQRPRCIHALGPRLITATTGAREAGMPKIRGPTRASAVGVRPRRSRPQRDRAADRVERAGAERPVVDRGRRVAGLLHGRDDRGPGRPAERAAELVRADLDAPSSPKCRTRTISNPSARTRRSARSICASVDASILVPYGIRDTRHEATFGVSVPPARNARPRTAAPNVVSRSRLPSAARSGG
jgi:hypothetical protein